MHAKIGSFPSKLSLMFTQEKYLPTITGEEFDLFLANGWFPMGQAIFTCHILFFENVLYSPVWIRLPLKGYTFRKGLRKLMRKNERVFQTLIRPAVIDEEKEQLFQLFRSSFKGQLPITLKSYLLDGEEHNIYTTYETAVYHGECLVAFSFFDLGHNSLASIKGIYDPQYAAYSLGLYTMLREIRYGVEQGFEYFYPGYIVPGYSRFDYKLRIGRAEEIEYFNLKYHQWQPLWMFDTDKLYGLKLLIKLRAVANALVEKGVSCQILTCLQRDEAIPNKADQKFPKSPLFINIFNKDFPHPRFTIYFDIWKEKFYLTHCMTAEEIESHFGNLLRTGTSWQIYLLHFVLKDTLIKESTNPHGIIFLVVQMAKLLKSLDSKELLH